MERGVQTGAHIGQERKGEHVWQQLRSDISIKSLNKRE